MKGPRPTPTAIKRLRGSVRRDRVRADEPQVEPITTDAFDVPPELLAGDAIAAAEWQRLAPLLRRAKIATEADRGALLAVCLQWSIYLRSCKAADADDLVTRRGTGALGISPHATIAHRALQSLIRLWPELGLTPSGRTRISEVPISVIDNDFTEFDTPLPRGPQQH